MSIDATSPERVIFLCTHNSARSQMAEGMLRAWGGPRFDASSAGTVKTELRPEAVEVMREIGIDISAHTSKAIDQLAGRDFDRLVTVCDEARESCPTLPGVTAQQHWQIDDPSAVRETAEKRMAAFRRARDELAERVRALVAGSPAEGKTPARSRAEPAS
ncbi:MAG: arsenate reductase ArsC [Chloroflexota bacterium]|nr:arsenate reductase ArsC [Chloroflexota bacterium]